MFLRKKTKIYLSGHTGLVGSAILKRFNKEGYENLILKPHDELDLTRQSDVEHFLKTERPEYLFLCAAKVGGIKANSRYPAQFIYENIAIQSNVIHSAYKYGVKKLLFLGSACSYPRECIQPMKEDYLLSGYLEPTNEPYAVAKITGMKMCHSYNRQYGTNFISAISANIYGINDGFDPDDSHVIPALIRKFHEAKTKGLPAVTIWGTGNPRREFIYSEDVADACIFLMKKYNGSELVNIGTGRDISIKELAYLLKEITEFHGKIVFDESKPDGMPQKLLDISRIRNLGWKPQTPLQKGLMLTYNWYLSDLKGRVV